MGMRVDTLPYINCHRDWLSIVQRWMVLIPLRMPSLQAQFFVE